MYNFNLTEEISRWAFEIVCQNNEDWFISFTNPTAGPWKTIKGLDSNGNEGEIYRFDLEEKRPDIIIVNDKLKTIIIFEAKDSIDKLIAESQVPKSVEVVVNLTDVLRRINDQKYWGSRKDYKILNGLLWGAEIKSSSIERDSLFNSYYEEMKNYDNINKDIIIGIETRKFQDGLKCYVCSKSFNTTSYEDVLKSFGLDLF